MKGNRALEFLIKNKKSLENFFEGLEGPYSDSLRELKDIVEVKPGEIVQGSLHRVHVKDKEVIIDGELLKGVNEVYLKIIYGNVSELDLKMFVIVE